MYVHVYNTVHVYTQSLSQPDILDHSDPQKDRSYPVGTDLSMSQPVRLDTMDDVFTTDNRSTREEEEVKLVDWVFNMYVPTCKSLLECCRSPSAVDLKKLHQYLKLLSNAITFFCNEHQQIQLQKESVSPSKSFTGMDC